MKIEIRKLKFESRRQIGRANGLLFGCDTVAPAHGLRRLPAPLSVRRTRADGAGTDGAFKSGGEPHALQTRHERQARGCAHRAGGFTLIEVLLALMILAILLVVVHSIFYSALQLRNKTEQAFESAIPVQHTLSLIRRDIENIVPPGGTLSGTFQTTLTADSTMSISHNGQQCGPTFYTASAAVNDSSVWPEIEKVTYYLMAPTNGSSGQDLVRSVTRNLLPVLQEEYSDQRLMTNVYSLVFQYYDGTQWQDTWDSTTTSATTSNSLPQGVRMQLTLFTDDRGSISQTPIEMVIPIAAQGTNSTSTATGGGE